MFVIYCRQKYSDIRIKHTGMYFLADSNEIDVEGLTLQVQNKEKLNELSSNESEIVKVCMSFDDNYLAPGLTTIVSLLAHTSSKVHFYILCDAKLSNESRTVIESNMKIREM